MGKYVRILIAIVVLLSLVLLGRDKLAWAANSGPDSAPGQNTKQSISPHKDKHCNKDKDKKNEKCDDDDDGTVKPPKENVEACEKGQYSVGGVVTLQVKSLSKDGCLKANVRPWDPAVDHMPSSAGTVLSNVLSLELAAKQTNARICFAVPPGKQVNIYSSSQGSWKPVKTQVKNGVACANVSTSGNYTLAGN